MGSSDTLAQVPVRKQEVVSDQMALFSVRRCGAVMVASAGDWGPSDPLAVPEMPRRGHEEGLIRRVVCDNPLAFFSPCRRFESAERATEPVGVGNLSGECIVRSIA